MLYVLSTMYRNDNAVVGGAASSSSSMLAMVCCGAPLHWPVQTASTVHTSSTVHGCNGPYVLRTEKSVLLWVVGTSCMYTVLDREHCQNVLARTCLPELCQ